MTAKKIFRSAALKLLAFLAVVGCFAGALAHAEDAVLKLLDTQNSDGFIYQFDRSYEDARWPSDVINSFVSNLDYALHVGMSQQQFDGMVSNSYYVFPGDYYAVMGDTVLKNADLTAEQASDSPHYLIATPAMLDFSGQISFIPFEEWRYGDTMWNAEYSDETSEGMASYQYPENTMMFVRITEEQAARYETVWTEQRDIVMNTIQNDLILVVVAIALYIYLLFVTGRKGEDEDVHLVTVDRLFVEFNLLIGIGLLVLAGCANIAVIIEMIDRNASELHVLLTPTIVLFVAAFALALELSLSLVRNLKNRSLVQRSFLLRACRWCWKTAVRLCKWCWAMLCKAGRALGRARNAVANGLFRDYKVRNVTLILLGYTIVLAFCAMLFGSMIDYGEGFLALLFGIAWFIAACTFLLKRVQGFDRIVDGLKRLRAGELTYKLTDMPAGVFSSMAEDINSLGDGMQAALQNEIRAERMKSELITNVSHDLKTPLTSILNYSDLLCQEHLTPEEANDYAKIIHQKGMRLKNLTSDLFDISKVQSGAETIVCERLDACTLVRQALAEQDAAIGTGKLTLKLDLPEREIPIWADGKKMSRVMENLIGNCIKYSLAGTRVFLSVSETETGMAVIEIKNTANYAMDFDAGEITERFVRGDEARSTEGSGLGLAIAKSYVSACGGTLSVDVDGDLFKVRIEFAVYGRMTAE